MTTNPEIQKIVDDLSAASAACADAMHDVTRALIADIDDRFAAHRDGTFPLTTAAQKSLRAKRRRLIARLPH